MTDPSPSAATDELPELPSEAGGAPPSKRGRVRALWGVLTVLAVGLGAVAVQASDDEPARLPIALGAAGNATEEAAAADMSMLAYVHYSAGPDLPALGEDGPAYRLSDTVDEAAARELAGAFRLEADLEQDGEVWRATDGTHTLEVYPGFGAGWWYGPQDATKSSEPSVGISAGGGSDQGIACTEPADPAMATCTPHTTTSTISPDLPTKAEAEAIALDVLGDAGVATDGAKVTVDGPYDGWYVTVEPELDGRPTGMYSSVTVGEDGEVLFASGMLAEVTKVGDYATVDTGAAIDRLNEGYGGFAGAGYATDAMTDVAVAEGSSEAGVTTECVASADGRESCTVTPAPPPVCPDPARTTTTVLDDGATTTVGAVAVAPDTPVSSEAVATEQLPADLPCGVTYPVEPTEPLEVVLHEAEPILMLVGATDGSDDGYLVPGYRFTGDDDTVVDQMAIADDALAPVAVPDPGTTDPGSIEPATDPAVDPSSVEPSSGSGSSSDPGSAGDSSGYDPDGSVSSPVQPDPGTDPTAPGPTTPCTLPKPGPNGEVPLIGCAEPAAG